MLKHLLLWLVSSCSVDSVAVVVAGIQTLYGLADDLDIVALAKRQIAGNKFRRG